MTDDDLMKRVANVLHEHTNDPMWSCVVIARAVLDAIDLPGLLAAAKAEAWDEGAEHGYAAAFATPHSGNPYLIDPDKKEQDRG